MKWETKVILFFPSVLTPIYLQWQEGARSKQPHLVIDEGENYNSRWESNEAHCWIFDIDDVFVQILNMVVLHLNATALR